jgi:GT2 family glycosyltransferase
MSQPTPQLTDDETLDEVTSAPRVRVLITAVADADLEAAMAVVGRQVYEPAPEIVVVGEDLELDDDGIATASTLEEAINSTDSSFDYLWLLHADARPRPDALGALIAESERNDASLAGSKLLKAGTMDELESVGGATDVFGEPYSGLDEGEIDLQQYDVVREVAFVQSASMLVRRDLAQGLRGLDPLLPPVAAGLDFSQRTRLAGGKVISVPSSEVYHQARCGQRGKGWREQAGRLRAMLIAYRPLTLLWVVPYDLLVSVLDSVVSLLLLRWKPLVRHLYSWSWNLVHLYSTIRQRRRLGSIRSEGDEELFRFQAKGSIRLRAIGEEISGRALSVFDDDQALARGSRRLWGSPGVWGAVAAAVIAFISARAIVFVGMTNSGFSFPFEPATIALERWFTGWNEAGLGSAAPVHPSVGLTGLLSLVWFGAAGAARTLLTLALSVVGIIGMGRFAGRIGLRGPGRYLAGLVVIAGPGTAVLVGRGSWLALAAAACLPWAVRSAFVHPHEFGRSRLSYVGWALLTALIVASFSPLLAVVPLLVVVVWRLFGGDRGGVLLGLVSVLGGVAGAAFLAADPGWIYDSSRVVFAEVDRLWPILILVGAAPLLFTGGRTRTVALTGGVIALSALAMARALALGPGLQEAVLITASLGTALVVAAALDVFSRKPLELLAAVAALMMLIVSLGSVGNGRLGLPNGDLNERLGFSTTLAEDHGPGRILYASVDRETIPGEARSGPGFWYRVLDGVGTTHDEVWLPARQEGDDRLDAVLAEIGSGAELRPGAALAPFAIDWVVLEGPTFVLDDVLAAQLDLVPTPLDPTSRVYENLEAAPLAGNDEVTWSRDATGFSGDRSDNDIVLSLNHSPGWERNGSPERWAVAVDGVPGRAWYAPSSSDYLLPGASLTLLVMAIGMIVWGRRRS